MAVCSSHSAAHFESAVPGCNLRLSSVHLGTDTALKPNEVPLCPATFVNNDVDCASFLQQAGKAVASYQPWNSGTLYLSKRSSSGWQRPMASAGTCTLPCCAGAPVADGSAGGCSSSAARSFMSMSTCTRHECTFPRRLHVCRVKCRDTCLKFSL
jgi:hypothetical protein